MMNTLGYIVVIILMTLLGFWLYCFLLKVPKHGKTKIRIKFALLKILKIEFNSEHEDNSKEST